MEEQKRAQQEQAEQLGQRLAERLRESSARRLLYLEQIKERAAVDPDRLRYGSSSDFPCWGSRDLQLLREPQCGVCLEELRSRASVLRPIEERAAVCRERLTLAVLALLLGS